MGTAVAIAAHEVGHAIQFHRREAIFQLRERYMPIALRLRQAGETLRAVALTYFAGALASLQFPSSVNRDHPVGAIGQQWRSC